MNIHFEKDLEILKDFVDSKKYSVDPIKKFC